MRKIGTKLLAALAVLAGLLGGAAVAPHGPLWLALAVSAGLVVFYFLLLDYAFWQWSTDRFDMIVYQGEANGKQITCTHVAGQHVLVPVGQDLVIRGSSAQNVEVFMQPTVTEDAAPEVN